MKPPVRFSAHAQPHHDCRSGYILIESANEGDGHFLSACALMLMACSAWDDETPSQTLPSVDPIEAAYSSARAECGA